MDVHFAWCPQYFGSIVNLVVRLQSRKQIFPCGTLQKQGWCPRNRRHVAQECSGWLFQRQHNYFTSSDPHHDIYRFVTGKSSGILSDISSGIRSGILSGISSGIYSGISSGMSSGILSGIFSGRCSGISSGIPSDILSGISSGILSARWGPAVHTELGRSPVEVQRCTLRWANPRLRSSGAGQVPGWGPAVHTELEVQRCTLSWAGPRLRSQCTLSWEVGKELGEESWQRAWRRVGKAEVEVEVDTDMVEEKLEGEEDEEEEDSQPRRRRRRTALIKTNNPHLAGGEKHWKKMQNRQFKASGSRRT